MRTIGTFLALALSVVAILMALPTDSPVGADSIKFVGGHSYVLSGSGITSSQNTVPLTSFEIPQTEQPFQMSDFGDVGYGTIEPGNKSRQEIVSFTGITQNSDGSATLTGVSRGLSPIAPYTASSTLQFPHPGSSSFIVSNAPQLFDELAAKDNDETITGEWTYSSTTPPIYDGTFTVASTSQELAPASWVNSNFLDPGTTTARTLFGSYTFDLAATFSKIITVSGTSATSSFANGITLGYTCDGGTGNTAVCDKQYIDGVAAAGASDANETTKGIVEEATLSEITSESATGGTGAKLFVPPDKFAQGVTTTMAFYSASSNGSEQSQAVSGIDGNDILIAWGTVDDNSGTCENGITGTLQYQWDTDSSRTTLMELSNAGNSNNSLGCSAAPMGLVTATTTNGITFYINDSAGSSNSNDLIIMHFKR